MSIGETVQLRAPTRDAAVMLCDILPILRMNALAQGRGEAAEDLVWDAVLEWLVAASLGSDPVPSLGRIQSTMRTAMHTRNGVGARGGMAAGSERRLRRRAAAIHALPPDEREAVILLALLGAGPERAAELADVAPGTVIARQMRGLARLAAREALAGPLPVPFHLRTA